ncbi:MAG: cobalt-precorrin-5B (C(1))-methyltransferase CbiD [Thermodesulfobacteriota bacterium]
MAAKRRLRTGFTTGACAAAAAKGATLLLLGRSPAPTSVSLRLPWGAPHAAGWDFDLVGCTRTGRSAECGVVKDAGDDPDVTDGVEIRASVSREGSAPAAAGVAPLEIFVEAGPGVGRVTKPGLALPVGEAAINPVPREMIRGAVADALAEAEVPAQGTLRVVVSVPRGEEIAGRTLNARLGILGGLSILGTTGIVIPLSADAWRATVDAALDVARAAGVPFVVLSHGRSSESAAQALFPELPPESFVLMGDHVGYSLDAAASRGLAVVLAGQFAKFCKVAGGSFETHVKDSALDRGLLRDLLREAGFPGPDAEAALGANTAREVFHRLLETGDRGVFEALARRVARRASERIAQGGGRSVPVAAVLFGYDKALLARGGAPA